MEEDATKNADGSRLEATICLALNDSYTVFSVSDSIENLLGFTAEDCLSARASLKDRIHPHDSDIAETLFSRNLENTSGVFNIRIRQANGRIRCIRGFYEKRSGDSGCDITLNLLLQDAKSLKRTLDDAVSMANFRAMMDNTDDFIYFKDRNHVFTGASQTLVSLCSPAKHWTDLIGQTDYDVFSEEYADAYYRLEKKVFAGMPVAHEIQETLTNDGKKGWVDNRKYPITDESGEIIGLYGIARDITELKQTEVALKESEFFFKESQRAASIGSYKADFISGTWESSEVLDQIFGIDKNYNRSIQGWIDLIHPDDKELMDRYLIEEIISKHLPFNIEYRIIRKSDGEIRWVNGLGEVHTDVDGNVTLLIGTIQDITEHKQINDKIKRLTTLLDETQHIAQVGGWEIDLTTNSLYWTDETYRIHDTSPSEYTPTIESAMSFYAPESLAIISSAVKEAIEENKDFNLELKLITAKGRPILVHTTSKVVRENGKPVKILGAFKDITEQRKLEEKLRQSLKMESIGRLAGGVAHDFNNKLAIILGYAELLRLEFPENQRLHKKLNDITTAAEHSRDITGQLLTFSRQQIISPKSINLNAAIKDTKRTLPRLIGEDIALSYDLANTWNVMIDPVQLDQIVMNLAVNAKDAMPDGGELKISTGNTTVDETFCQKYPDAYPGAYVQLTVSDSGCGMNIETLKHIFEPFYTTKEVGKGTGLGLATIYGIVTQNNGFITVSSEPGRGTTFSTYLPRLEERGETKAKEANELVQGAGTVLLVEDDETVLKMTASMLELLGYSVLQAATPNDAIRLCGCAETRIDMVISDVIMPAMNGKAMIDRIKVLRPDIKTLFMSGYSSSHISEKGIVEGKVYFIQKPFNMVQLSEKVREVFTAHSKNL